MKKKIAIVHDWLVTYAGAERVLEHMLQCFPGADIFSVVDFFDSDARKHLQNKKAITTFIQKLPFARTKYRTYLPLMPLAIEQLNLSKYDVIISNSHAVAKGIITGPDQLHISHVCSPMRYAWDLQHQYLEEARLTKGIRSWLARYMLHRMRLWDLRTANGVDEFAAISHFIARRIWKVYRREATVIYPPVDTDYFIPNGTKEDFYLTVSRMVPYKKMDLIVKVFAGMPQKKLVVIGDGPQMQQIQKYKTDNVMLLGYQSSNVIKQYMQKARAFVFAAEEDFGIVPLEAQACGTPVIAYGKGGCLETISGDNPHAPAGIFFTEQTEESLTDAVKQFENLSFSVTSCRNNALRFSQENFRRQFIDFVNKAVKNFETGNI